ncbi:hypothetical protein [Kocuria rhizophila]|uniref:hypothetical protein n=1 Tax=Kocuria rhizophila TaxID=72000 RepID=UPI0021A74A4E|nr:hypothetical protein [Kocuria rhizophila]MCT1544873.1 hypothetical protein [Kocuria rhizophila]MCT2249683.1 hypothetical protein [Kocuria rhizophila]
MLTKQIRTGLNHAQELIVLAWQGRAWESMSYRTWDEYVAGEFSDLSLRPPLETRSETLSSMRGAGMSIRAISAATTLSPATISRALKESRGDDPEDGPHEVVGLDGKAYRPTPPRKAAAADVELPDELLDLPAEEVGVTPFVPKPARATGGAAPSLAGMEAEAGGADTPRPEDFGLIAARARVSSAYEAVRASLEVVNEHEGFPVEVQSPELVDTVTKSLLVLAGLLERLRLCPERLPEHDVVARHLQVAAVTLDRVAERLGGEADG